jgi:hypothetical protein
MTLGELAIATNRASLLACLDICGRYQPDMDIKERRLIVEIAGMTTRANLRIAEGEFRGRRDDRLLEVLKAIAGFTG